MKYVLGVEAMHSEARTDSSGLLLIEHAPWGVIGMSLPVTHAVPTMVANAINILAAGNTAIFAPHPSASASHSMRCSFSTARSSVSVAWPTSSPQC